jgi:HEAT repeat protein
LGPTTDAPRTGRTDPSAWQTWWRFHRDHFVELKQILAGLETRTVGDGAAPIRALRATSVSEVQVARDVIPALQRTLERGGKFEVIRGALIALARIEHAIPEHDGATVPFYAKFFLGAKDQESAEASIVALGVRGDPANAPFLIDLLLDTEAGRAARGGVDKVDYRIRSLAAYSLGLIGHKNADPALRREIARALILNIESSTTAPFDTQLAALTALGMVPMEPCDEPPGSKSDRPASEHFCRGRQVALLQDYIADPQRHGRLRAQAAVPLARLTSDSAPEHRAVVIETFLQALDSRSKAGAEIQQGCILALGELADADDDELDREVVDTLAREATRGERLTRALSLVSLARIAGRPGSGESSGKTLAKVQSLLLKQLSLERSGLSGWSAMALGVLGRTLAEHKQVVPADVAAGLRTHLAVSRDADEVASSSLALAMLRDAPSGDILLTKLARADGAAQRACLTLALGLVGAKNAREPLRERIATAQKDTDEFRNAAVALRLLGERSAVASLIEATATIEDPKARAGAWSAVGVAGDSSAATAMVAALDDPSQPDEVRGAVAAALGELCDTRARAWTDSISSFLHHDLVSSTLLSYAGDGTGLLEMR